MYVQRILTDVRMYYLCINVFIIILYSEFQICGFVLIPLKFVINY